MIIWVVKSEWNQKKEKGATFWFTLPYKQAETVEKPLPKKTQTIFIEKDKLIILIAEDNESNYKLFESILKYDYHLIHAWDGQEAVNMFKKNIIRKSY